MTPFSTATPATPADPTEAPVPAIKTSAQSSDAPANPSRRLMFRKFAQAGDPGAPHRAVWRRVTEVGAGHGNVLWTGWADQNNVLVAGDDGTILHYDGAADADGGMWHSMQSPTRLPLHALWGRCFNELHAVGWMGTVLSFDGTRWQQRRGGVVDPDTGGYASCTENAPLFDLTGDASGRAWAVGDAGTVLAFDNEQWQAQTTATQANLRGIACTPAGQLFAVGGDGTVITSSGNGQWDTLDCPIAAGFTSVLALSDNELLMAGGRYFVGAGGFRGELLRWRDGQFTVIDAAKDMPRIRALRPYKNGVLIAADQGHLYYLEGERLDQLRTDCRHDLMDIVGLHSGEALVVGDFSTIMTAADDFITALVSKTPHAAPTADWQLMDSGTQHNLWGLTSGTDGTVYACGDGGTVLQYRDGSWQALPPISEASVHCLWAAGDGGLYAGGSMGQIHRYDGTFWEQVFDLYLDITILAMWGSGPNSIYAVGDEGLILHWNGEKWQRLISGTKSALYNVWGFSDSRVLAVGDFGLVLRWNGESWAEFHAGTDNFLFDVWGDALDNIFIVGLSGTLVHFDGERWNLTPARVRDDLMAIDGQPGKHPFAAGSQGSILHFDGLHWQQEAVPVQTSLRAIHACTNGDVFAAGNNGVILKRRADTQR